MAHPIDDCETAPEIPAIRRECVEGEELGLVVLHAPDDAEHTGAWLSAARTTPQRPGVFGRGPSGGAEKRVRLKPVRQRPESNVPLPPFSTPSLSRDQLLVTLLDTDVLEVTNIGRLPLAANGQLATNGRVRAGDVLELGTQLVLLVAQRPAALGAVHSAATHHFGAPDPFGYVGESPAAWALRREIAFMGPLRGHVLVTGATGTGKEIVAAAFHELSERGGALVARNAATFPDALVDAELFGNLKGYPNPGMPERKGLVGAADRGTLFLDEFAELGPEAQAKLLRVLDSGEYQTLGESRVRRSDFRLIAATNRPDTALRHDLLARFDLRLRTPSLSERTEDLPFLVRELLVKMTEGSPELYDRVFRGGPWPLLSPTFVSRLARTPLLANVRELRALLWQSISRLTGEALEWPDETLERSLPEPEGSEGDAEARRLERVIAENGGSIEKSWRVLGLSSRFALMRLLRKHGVVVQRRPMRE